MAPHRQWLSESTQILMPPAVFVSNTATIRCYCSLFLAVISRTRFARSEDSRD
jgi:hypothetical protein